MTAAQIDAETPKLGAAHNQVDFPHHSYRRKPSCEWLKLNKCGFWDSDCPRDAIREAALERALARCHRAECERLMGERLWTIQELGHRVPIELNAESKALLHSFITALRNA